MKMFLKSAKGGAHGVVHGLKSSTAKEKEDPKEEEAGEEGERAEVLSEWCCQPEKAEPFLQASQPRGQVRSMEEKNMVINTIIHQTESCS